MILAIIELLKAGLSLWDDKEKNKYTDKLLSLERDYYDEDNKPEDQRDDAKLDNISFELRILSSAFTTSVNKQQSALKAKELPF